MGDSPTKLLAVAPTASAHEKHKVSHHPIFCSINLLISKTQDQLEPSQQPPAPKTTFQVIYDDGYAYFRFDVPFDEKFEIFLTRFGPVERTAMRYSLMDRQGQRDGMERLLTGNLFYQAMISELVKRPAMWNCAVVWQVSLGSEFQDVPKPVVGKYLW